MPSLSQLPFIESLSIATTIRFGANKILIDAAGREQRIVPHQSPLREYSLFKKALTPAEGNALFALFESTEGRKNTFLYQDKSDYAATRTPKTLATGVYTQGVVLNIAGQYLLCKKYVCGANTHYRPIYSANDLIIYDSGGTVVSGSFATGGLITGLTGSGHTASFTFDIPVRFGEDSIDRVIETKKVNKLYSVSLTLIEQRFPLPASVTDIFLDDCAHQFAIDFLFKSTTSQVFNNQVKDLTSGFNKIVQYQSDPITEIVFGERSAIPAVDLEYLQAFWLCVKSSGAFWDFEDDEEVVVKAAFRDNALSYTLTAPQPQQYSVAPLTARLFYEGIATDAGHDGWTGSVLTLCDCVVLREVAAPTCTPKSLTFSNPLTSPLPVLIAQNTGIYAGATYSVDTSGGFWRTTLTYGGVGNGYAASIVWSLPYSYVPTFANEVISIAFSVEARLVSSNATGGSYPFSLFAVQGGILLPLVIDSGTDADWNTYTSSGNFSGFELGVPIIFLLGRSNSAIPGDTTAYTTIADYRNVSIIVNVACS